MRNRFLATLLVLLTFVQLAFGYELSILHSNDIHGRVMPVESNENGTFLGGWSRRSGLIKKIKSDVKNTLVLDAGDVAQGTIYYQLFDGMPEMNFLYKSGYDAMTVGNHELDKGVANFENLTKFSKVPLLAANLNFKKNFYLNGKIKSHMTKNYDNFKVGVIGMTTPALRRMSVASKEVEMSNFYKTLTFFVEYLRDDVDLLVLLSHSGYDKDVEIAKRVKGLDVIVGGHSHTFLDKPYSVMNDGRKTLIVQAGEFGMKLGKLDVTFDKSGIESYEYSLIPLDESCPVDARIEKEIKKLNLDVNKIKNTKIGKTKVPIDARKKSLRTELTNSGVLVCESMKRLYPEVDAVVINAGSIRSHKVLPKGKLTNMDIMEMLPFPNKIVMLEVQGKDIKSMLEASASAMPRANRTFLQTLGISYTVDMSKQAHKLSGNLTKLINEGCRIKNVKINGKALNEESFYKVLTTDFLYSGGDGFYQFEKARSVANTNYSVTKAVIDYVTLKKRVSPQVRDEIIKE